MTHSVEQFITGCRPSRALDLNMRSRFRQFRHRRCGFTLIELVVVVLILGVIAAVAGTKMFDTVDQTKASSAATLVSLVRNQIDLYHAASGAYPETIDPASFHGQLTNPYAPEKTFANVQSVVGKMYPSIKTLQFSKSCWYNKTNGQFMVRVPVQESDAATITLFNRVNNTAITSLGQTL